MADLLWLTLYPDSVTWCTESPDGAWSQQQAGDITLFIEQYDGQTPIIVLMGLADVYIKQVEAQHLNSAQIKKAMPFIIEDEILGDIDQIHTHVISTTPFKVLIMPKQTWHWWQDKMNHLNIKASYLLSQLLPNRNTMLVTSNIAYAQNETHHFGCPVDLIDNFQSLHDGMVWDTIGVVGDAPPSFEDKTFNLIDSVEPWVKPQIEDAQSLWSTIQESGLPLKQVAKQVGIFMGICFISLITLKSIEIQMLQSKNKAIDDKIAEIYFQIFPQATQVIAPKLRIEQLLSKHNNPSGDTFFELTHALGQAINETAIDILEMQFQSNTLVAKLKVKQYEQISQFIAAISADIQVKEQDTRTQDDGLVTTIIMTKGGAS